MVLAFLGACGDVPGPDCFVPAAGVEGGGFGARVECEGCKGGRRALVEVGLFTCLVDWSIGQCPWIFCFLFLFFFRKEGNWYGGDGGSPTSNTTLLAVPALSAT